jgi:DNA recombination-mediator protein A
MNSTLIGITGHRTLSVATRKLVSDALKDELAGVRDLVVVSSLAAGADQICAELALEAGGRLVVVLPAQKYEESFSNETGLANFTRLLDRAAEIISMPFEQPGEEAYWAAGREVVDRVNWLLAVWDGQPARGLGGTADVVAYARSMGKRVTVIWPDGAARA